MLAHHDQQTSEDEDQAVHGSYASSYRALPANPSNFFNTHSRCLNHAATAALAPHVDVKRRVVRSQLEVCRLLAHVDWPPESTQRQSGSSNRFSTARLL
jgi:hypothetical protein